MLKYVLAFIITASASFSFAASYTLDKDHSNVGFKVTHMMISSVSGHFDAFEGGFNFDPKTGKLNDVTAKIDLTTVNTSNTKRDDHLKSPDFFGARDKDGKVVEAKRWMTFKSTKVENKGTKPVSITGNLTLNGVTKPVTLKVDYKGAGKDPWGNDRVGFEATGKINRKDFGMAWNKALEAGGVLVGDEVAITLDGEAMAKKDEKTAQK